MLYWINKGGIFSWIQLVLLLVIIYMIIREALTLIQQKKAETVSESGVHAILFWGCFSVAVGFFAHYFGVYQAMSIIASARDISPGMVSKGYADALVPVIFGFITLLIAGLAWLILRNRAVKLKKN